MESDVLFQIKNKKTGKIYDCNRRGLNEYCEDNGRNLFRPFDLLIGSNGELMIINTCDDISDINADNIEIIWNKEHKLFNNI